jgi:protein farnesyltransferase subunit beta
MTMSSLIDGKRMEYLLESSSTEDQEDAELECRPFRVSLASLSESDVAQLRHRGLLAPNSLEVCLLYDAHTSYLQRALRRGEEYKLSHSFVSLDSSRPWMIYWTLHACDLIGSLPDEQEKIGIVSTLQACWDTSSGGFGGGPGQMAHCAPTYAAVLSLCILATCPSSTNPLPTSVKEARSLLTNIREPLLHWYRNLQNPKSGAYCMHAGGERDVRATYIVVCCSKLLNILDDTLINSKVIQYILDCQTYEGGFGGEPGSEAHGGYNYCAVSALQILGLLTRCDVDALRGWLVRRQMSYEGGFQGRCNKLVDGCYSFWQGAAIALLQRTEYDQDKDIDSSSSLLFREAMLQRYILLCAQDMNGGLRDKPSTSRDFYHSCYNLSGLSISQHFGSLAFGDRSSSMVAKTHPSYNIRVDRVDEVMSMFHSE